MGIDAEAMRMDEIIEAEQFKPAMSKHSALFKLKYMCRKCEGKEIWTTRDRVTVRYCVLDIKDYEKAMEKRNETLKKEEVYDGHTIRKKYQEYILKLKEKGQ